MFLTDNITLIVLLTSAIAAALLVVLDQIAPTAARTARERRTPGG